MSASTLEGGFLMLAVSLGLTVVAVSAFLLARESGMELQHVSATLRSERALYAAEAGFRHQLWRVRAANCSGYTDLASTPFGSASYSATVAPTAGSPVAIVASGALADGTRSEYRRDAVPITTPPTTTTTTLQPGIAGADTYIDDDLNGENFGGHADLAVAKGAMIERRGLLRFDLSFLPAGATIQSAELRLYLEGNPLGVTASIGAHRVTNSWVEGTQVGAGIDGASWDDRDVGVPWITEGADFAPAASASATVNAALGWRSWNLTALVSDWAAATYPNYGVLLKTSNSVDLLWFTSGDDPQASQHPILEITYVSPERPCPSSRLVLSVEDAAALGSLSFEDEDLVDYQPPATPATLLFDGSTRFSANEDVDAVYMRPNGHRVLSTEDAATLGGLSFQDEDLVDYDPAANTATLLFDGSTRFSGDEDVDAVHVLPNGHLVLSTEDAATLGGLGFQDEDLVDYDPAANTATLLFDGSTRFSGDEDVDAVHVLPNGHLVLSTEDAATLGGQSFQDEDLIDYDPSANTATLLFDGSAHFTGDEDVDAVHIQ